MLCSGHNQLGPVSATYPQTRRDGSCQLKDRSAPEEGSHPDWPYGVVWVGGHGSQKTSNAYGKNTLISGGPGLHYHTDQPLHPLPTIMLSL